MERPEAAVQYLQKTVGIVANPSRNDIPASKSGPGDGWLANIPEKDQHRLMQAAFKAKDPETALNVIKALGLHGEDKKPVYDQFLQAHKLWGRQDTEFVQQMQDISKARSYVQAHFQAHFTPRPLFNN